MRMLRVNPFLTKRRPERWRPCGVIVCGRRMMGEGSSIEKRMRPGNYRKLIVFEGVTNIDG